MQRTPAQLDSDSAKSALGDAYFKGLPGEDVIDAAFHSLLFFRLFLSSPIGYGTSVSAACVTLCLTACFQLRLYIVVSLFATCFGYRVLAA